MGAQHLRGRLNLRGGERVERMLRLGGRTREDQAQEGTQQNEGDALAFGSFIGQGLSRLSGRRGTSSP